MILRQIIADEINSSRIDNDVRKISLTSNQQESIYKEIFGMKIETLQLRVANNKKFMNMVIHDMRNPTTAI